MYGQPSLSQIEMPAAQTPPQVPIGNEVWILLVLLSVLILFLL